jgi:hypothetical protein
MRAPGLADAGDRVAEIEQHWASVVGSGAFDGACRRQNLLDALDQPERD